MTDEEIIEAIRRAERIVGESGLDLETPRGTAAFDVVLRKVLQRDRPHQADGPEENESPGDDASPLAYVARWAGVDPEVLSDAFEFGPEEVELNLWHGRLPNGKAERQRVLALAKLGVERIGYGREEVTSRELNSLCEKYECLDQNIPGNIQQRNLVQRRGRRGSYNYRLTLAGVDSSRDVIRGLVGAD